jgi:hypothetical protein
MLQLHWDRARYPEESASLEMLEEQSGVLVVGSDFSDAARTLAALVEARRKGLTVALYPMLGDPLEGVTEQVAVAIASQTDAGARHTQLLAMAQNRLNVNQKPFAEAAQYQAPVLHAVALAVKLADLLLVFTAAEKERWSAISGKPVRDFAYLPVPRMHEPPNAAPSAFVALALRVTDTRPDAGIAIVSNWWRPARVAALAAAGHRVVAPSSGSPDERCVCATYRPTDAFALKAAVDAVQTGSTGLRFDVDAREVHASIAATRPAGAAGARVCVIVRTFDRPGLLRRAIRSITAQTYPDVEIVVVNNGGADVEQLVAQEASGRPYRYVRLPDRSTISAASNAGARAASGSYVGYLDDDDILYPDHFARAVEALERADVDIVYTNCLAEYAEMQGDEKQVLGFAMFRESEFNLHELYVDNVAPIHSIVHRRDLFDRFGYFDEHLPVTDDWEMWLRCAHGGARFLHVDRVTCEYSWRHDPTRGNMTLTHQKHFAEHYETIVSRYAGGAAAYPFVRERQQQIVEANKQRRMMLEQPQPGLAAAILQGMAKNAVPAPGAADPFA